MNFLCTERTLSWWAWSWWRHFLLSSRLLPLILNLLCAERSPSAGDPGPDDGISCRHLVSTLLYWTSCVQKEHLPGEPGTWWRHFLSPSRLQPLMLNFLSRLKPLMLNFLCAERTPFWWAWSWWRHVVWPPLLRPHTKATKKTHYEISICFLDNVIGASQGLWKLPEEEIAFEKNNDDWHTVGESI